jgi:hypothetical protein
MMSPKGKFIIALLALTFVGFAIVGAWAITGKDWIAYSVFGWVFVASWLLGRVTCPVCGTPVAYSAKAGRVQVLTALPRSTCEECGHDLTKS